MIGMAEIAAFKEGSEMAGQVLNKDCLRWLKTAYNKYLVGKAAHFSDYKEKMQENFEFIRNSAIGNAQRSFEEVFVPLAIIDETDQAEYAIEAYPRELIRRYSHLIIKDYAGRGKSTLMRKLFVLAVNAAEYPLFIELRNLNDGTSLIHELLKGLHKINEKFNEDLLRYLLRHEDFVIILDGFDEVDNDRREGVTKEITELVSQAKKSYFIMTSRDEDSLTGFGHFRGFYIKDFTIEQACDLITKYDNEGPVGQRLVTEIRDGQHQEVAEFLKSPLHTSLFYKVFKDKRGLPYRLHEVCAEIYHHLFNLHDLAKDGSYEHQKKCNLSEQDFAKVLGYIAFYCLKNGCISISRTDLPVVFDNVRQYYADINIKDDDFLYDMVVSLSLFKDQRQEVSWIHESMCHYFASYYLRMDNSKRRRQALTDLCSSSKLNNYLPMIKMFGELEPIEFRKYMLAALLQKMNQQYGTELASSKMGIDTESKYIRCYLLYGYEIEYDSGNGTVNMNISDKAVKFLLKMIYEISHEDYKDIPIVEIMPEDWGVEKCKKKRLRINGFSDTQVLYDYANSEIAKNEHVDAVYLNYDGIQNLLKKFDNEVLISEDADLLQNI